MIDNFELIKPLFYFNEANNMFFHCQIVRRAKTSKPVGQFDLEGNLIATYFGVREATRCTGINGSHIGDCCNHKPNRKTAGGFKWEWQ